MAKRSPARPLWKRLRVGDRIRITAIPQEFLRPGVTFHRDTRRLYERLIEKRSVVRVTSIDDWGYPWISYRHRDDRGRLLYHGLMIGPQELFVVVPQRKS